MPLLVEGAKERQVPNMVDTHVVGKLTENA
jgi:hypothetical protein